MLQVISSLWHMVWWKARLRESAPFGEGSKRGAPLGSGMMHGGGEVMSLMLPRCAVLRRLGGLRLFLNLGWRVAPHSVPYTKSLFTHNPELQTKTIEIQPRNKRKIESSPFTRHFTQHRLRLNATPDITGPTTRFEDR